MPSSRGGATGYLEVMATASPAGELPDKFVALLVRLNCLTGNGVWEAAQQGVQSTPTDG